MVYTIRYYNSILFITDSHCVDHFKRVHKDVWCDINTEEVVWEPNWTLRHCSCFYRQNHTSFPIRKYSSHIPTNTTTPIQMVSYKDRFYIESMTRIHGGSCKKHLIGQGKDLRERLYRTVSSIHTHTQSRQRPLEDTKNDRSNQTWWILGRPGWFSCLPVHALASQSSLLCRLTLIFHLKGGHILASPMVGCCPWCIQSVAFVSKYSHKWLFFNLYGSFIYKYTDL